MFNKLNNAVISLLEMYTYYALIKGKHCSTCVSTLFNLLSLFAVLYDVLFVRKSNNTTIQLIVKSKE
jgi:hypothetical protein